MRTIWRRIHKADIVWLILLCFLFIPGDSQLVQDVRVYVALCGIFVLPGYICVRILEFFGYHVNAGPVDWPERWTVYLAFASVLGLVPWALVFFANVPIPQVAKTLIAFDVLGLIALVTLSVIKEHSHCKGRRGLRGLNVLLIFIILMTAAGAYIYGGLVTFDAYTYLPYIRDLYEGDLQPTEWNHISGGDPPFTDINSPLLLGYVMGAVVASTDPVVVWTRVPAFWTVFVLLVGYTLTKFLFQKRNLAILSLALAPVLYWHFPLGSGLARNNILPTFVFLPLVFLLSLQYILNDRRGAGALWLASFLGMRLFVDHVIHFVWFVMLLAAFGVGLLVVERKITAWLRRLIILLGLTILLSVGPALWMRWLASLGPSDYNFTAQLAMTETSHFARGLYWELAPGVVIVNPTHMLGRWISGPWVGLLSVVITLLFARRFLTSRRTTFLVTTVGTVLFVSMNPLLIPVLAGLSNSNVVHRLGSCLPVLPVVSFGLFSAGVTLVRLIRSKGWRLWRMPGLLNRRQVRALIVIILAVPLFALRLLSVGYAAVETKTIDALYSPADMSPVWLNRKLRSMVEAKLVSPPYPITESPTRLSRYLDAQVVAFIRDQLEDNSVFLSEPLTEIILPGYVNQRVFLGRGRWSGSTCESIRSGEWAPRRPELAQKILDGCTILDPEASDLEVRDALLRVADEVDYILVTPMRRYLDERLCWLGMGEKLYDEDGFSVWRLDGELPRGDG